MAEKPRVKAPKQRAGAAESGRNTRTWAIVAAIGGLVLGAVVVAAAFGFAGGGGGKVDVPALRAKVEAAGCTLQVGATPGYPGNAHSVTDPNGTSPVWTTDPPTSGPHYGQPAVFGIYTEPLQLARVVHNLEHGGVYILYGKDVPASTVDQLRGFYESHTDGTIMAPLDRLGDKFALGAWVEEDGKDRGFLAKCTSFDEDAVSSFFQSLQFRGPERFDPSDLQPGE
jgi:Protein of unknown function (DUF3105)